VFIEKPMGITLQQGRDILAAEKASGKHVAVDLEMHVIGIGPTVKAILDSGEIGKVVHIEFDHHRGNWVHSNPSGVYRTRKRTGGLMRMEGVHQMDLFRFWAGEITAVQSFCAPNALPHYEIPDNITVICWFENGALGRYTSSHTRSAWFDNPYDPRSPEYGHSLRWRITGTRGALYIDGWRTYIDVFHFQPMPAGTDSVTPCFVRRIDFRGLSDPLHWFYHDMAGCRRLFLERMAAGLPPLQSAADAFRAEQIAWAAEKSSFEQGQRIAVPPDWEG
jgi:predicted dehydrogenase